MSPQGAGARVLVRVVKEKIERELNRQLNDHPVVTVGLLTKSPNASVTASPIAVVCNFRQVVNHTLLAQAHRLAWNFARAPLLITVEPNLIRTWTCCEVPSSMSQELPAMIREASMDLDDPASASELAAHALNWVRLASGDFYRQFPERFKRDGRADRVLLDELTAVRKELSKQDLPDDTIHDLLARIIFAQFLFDRKDSEGNSAINPGLLKRLNNEGVLKQVHGGLSSILADYEEAYRFFRWLNSKFNGDLFPGKGSTKTAREAEWRAERKVVSEVHLQTLAEFVSGTLKLKSRQRFLWRQYAFDVIPLELISSIYEEFVTEKGAHYTPGFLVDYMLDGVLPWDGDNWDLKVLDPACGSGIFLVKAYQRLIQRWKNAHGQEQPPPPVLRRLLERNLFGVDIDEHAVRVASFSLYLTMCDEIDPKNYLRNTKFPRMRGERLIASDFFAEGVDGFDTRSDAGSYDLVIGNAPWGKDTVTRHAKTWSQRKEHRWPIANHDIGTLFLAKSALMAKPHAHVSMIQSASAFLFNSTGTSLAIRNQFLKTYSVEEITNLSPLRFHLFGFARRTRKSMSPPCIVSFVVSPPDDSRIVYVCPKNTISDTESEIADSNYSVIVEPQDVTHLTREESLHPQAWTSFAWGGRRDFYLMQRLSLLQDLESLENQGVIVSRRGVSRGKTKQIRQTELLDMPIIENDDILDDCFRYLDASELPINKDAFTHESDSTDMSAFALPQLIVKQSWQKGTARFKCAIVDSSPSIGAVLCTRSYFSIHVKNDDTELAQTIWATINSAIAVYFLLLSSGRLASWIPEPNKKDFFKIPLPPDRSGLMNITNYEELDQRVAVAFGLKDAEMAMIADLFRFTLPDFQGNECSAGRQLTQRVEMNVRKGGKLEPELTQYCEYFCRVLKAGFGEDVQITVKIFQEQKETPLLPVRLIAFYLDHQDDPEIQVEQIDSDELCFRLTQLNNEYLKTNSHDSGGIFFQRVARVYSKHEIDGKETAVIYIVKPDRVRYWTRSAGLRDGDEVAIDVQSWQLDNAPDIDGVDE